jgi:hypothetical protein
MITEKEIAFIYILLRDVTKMRKIEQYLKEAEVLSQTKQYNQFLLHQSAIGIAAQLQG